MLKPEAIYNVRGGRRRAACPVPLCWPCSGHSMSDSHLMLFLCTGAIYEQGQAVLDSKQAHFEEETS